MGVSVDNLQKAFRSGRGAGIVQAVNGITFEIPQGTTLGLVGESGCGKTTVGRCLLRLIEPDDGSILICGVDIRELNSRQLRQHRAKFQIVFQDPYGSVNPRMRIHEIIEEPIKLHTDLDEHDRNSLTSILLDRVGLNSSFKTRHPHQLSGGQLQRVGIARAIASSPEFIVLDEPTASLDAHVRAQILALLRELQVGKDLTYLLISHDLNLVANYCTTVAVMYLGNFVEIGHSSSIFSNPIHPYTQALLSASLSLDPDISSNRELLEGEPPSPIELPEGCVFASRCPLCIDECKVDKPFGVEIEADHKAWCIRTDISAQRKPG